MRVRPPSSLLLATGVAAASCVLAEINLAGRPCPCTDGYVCDEPTNTCVDAGAPSVGGAGPGGSMAGGMAEGGGGEGGGPGGAGPNALPLIAEGSVSAGYIALHVEGLFRVETDSAHNWHLARWYDLAVDPDVDLAGKNTTTYVDILHDSFQVQDPVLDWTSSAEGTVVTVTAIDQTPARFGIDLSMDYTIAGLRVIARYWVYANGRIGLGAGLTNTGATQLDLADSEYNYITVHPSLTWSTASTDFDHSAVFTRTDGPLPASVLQAINQSAETPVQFDFPQVNRYWQSGAQTLAPLGGMARHGALWLVPGGLDVATASERSADLRSPSLVAGAGAVAIGPGFNPEPAAYTLGAMPGATTVEFGVNTTRRRFSPAFVIEDWFEPEWSIRLGATELVRRDLPVGHDAVAWHDAAAGTLVFVYLGELPEGAPLSESTFTLEATP